MKQREEQKEKHFSLSLRSYIDSIWVFFLPLYIRNERLVEWFAQGRTVNESIRTKAHHPSANWADPSDLKCSQDYAVSVTLVRFLKGAARPLAPWTEVLGPSDATVFLETETISAGQCRCNYSGREIDFNQMKLFAESLL